MAELKNTSFDATDSLRLAVGTTGQRSNGNANARFNSSTGTVEIYQNGSWQAIDGNVSATVSGDVYTTNTVEDGTSYTIHVFKGSGTFTPSYAGEVEYLLVGGGGGGSDNQYDDGAGGGAGGVIHGKTVVTPQAYTITVGNGGGRTADGQDTTAFGLTAYKGGRGANHRGDNPYYNGGNIGSGGGAGGAYGSADGVVDGQTQGGQGTGGQGRDGGTNVYRAYSGSGGGGWGSDGQSVNSAGGDSNGGDGGKGYFSTIAGYPMWYAGGGGGYGYGTNGKGGIGGGGRGGVGTSIRNQPGAPNTGGGGGGGKNSSGYQGKEGGSGIVVVRYKADKTVSGGAPTVIDENLVLHLDAGDTRSYRYGGEENANNWYDIATGNYTAIVNGWEGVWEGTYGGGFNYTKRGSQTTDWIQLPHASLPSLGNAYTIEYWIQPTNDGTRYWNHNTVSGGNDSIHQISSNTIRHYNTGTGVQSFTNGEILQYTIVRYADGSGVTYKNGENPQSTTGLLDYTTAGIQGWVLNQEQDALLGGFEASQCALLVCYCLRTYSIPLGQRGVRQNFEAMRKRFGI